MRFSAKQSFLAPEKAKPEFDLFCFPVAPPPTHLGSYPALFLSDVREYSGGCWPLAYRKRFSHWRRQSCDATAETDWTIFLTLSIGHHAKFDVFASNFLTLASKNLKPPCLCENPVSLTLSIVCHVKFDTPASKNLMLALPV